MLKPRSIVVAVPNYVLDVICGISLSAGFFSCDFRFCWRCVVVLRCCFSAISALSRGHVLSRSI